MTVFQECRCTRWPSDDSDVACDQSHIHHELQHQPLMSATDACDVGASVCDNKHHHACLKGLRWHQSVNHVTENNDHGEWSTVVHI